MEAKPRGAGGALGDGAAADVRRHDDLGQILKEAKMAGFLRRKFYKSYEKHGRTKKGRTST